MLQGDDEARYVDWFRGVLRAARLNSSYPDSRALSMHVGAMSPTVHRGLYDGLQLHAESGLPSYREWTRVQTDKQIAVEQLAQLGSRAKLEASSRVSAAEIHQKQLKKHDYYSDLQGVTLAPLDGMQVLLRRIESELNRAHFTVVFDKLDAAGLFTRYTIDLSQQASVWGGSAVVLDKETAAYTEGFKALIYKFSSLDSELTFGRLAAIEGLRIDRVNKGTVGPFYRSGMDLGAVAPAPIAEMLGEILVNNSDGFVAMFALDSSAVDVANHQNNDPFGAFFGGGVSAELRAGYQQARQLYGYHVYRDRKFVVSKDLVEPMQKFCGEMNTQNIIYGL